MLVKLSLVMAVHNGGSTLPDVLLSLDSQSDKELIDEVIFIDDASTDNSREILAAYAQKRSFAIRILHHNTSMGLATTYNEGMDMCTSPFCIFMHQDILLPDPRSFHKISSSLLADKDVIAVYPTILIPEDVWRKYNFWQKSMLSRQVSRKANVFAGKFDCIRLTDLRFDADTYRTGGEDADMYFKLKKRGRLVASPLEVIHIHNMNPQFGIADFLHKEAQFGEIGGVQVRRLLPELARDVPLYIILMLFVRPGLLLMLLIPYLRYLALLLLLVFCFLYTKKVYFEYSTNPRIFLLPFVNFLGIVYYSLFFVRGWIHGKQRL